MSDKQYCENCGNAIPDSHIMITGGKKKVVHKYRCRLLPIMGGKAYSVVAKKHCCDKYVPSRQGLGWVCSDNPDMAVVG